MDTSDTSDTSDTATSTTSKCGDERAIFAECRARHATGDEISDACARAIAALWHGGQRSRAYAFASTGAILSDADPDTDTPEDIRYHDDNAPTALWEEIFHATTHHCRTHCTQYEALDPDWRLAADMFGTYLMRCTARGPQPGWSALWPRPSGQPARDPPNRLQRPDRALAGRVRSSYIRCVAGNMPENPTPPQRESLQRMRCL